MSRAISIRGRISRATPWQVPLLTLPHSFLTQPCEVRIIILVYPGGNGDSEKCVHLPRASSARWGQ